MTVGELIAQLLSQNPDTPVCLIVSDEFNSSHVVDIVGWERAVTPTGTHIELWGE